MPQVQITNITEQENKATVELYIQAGIGDYYNLDVTHDETSEIVEISGSVDGVATRLVDVGISPLDTNVSFSVDGIAGGLPVDDKVTTLIGDFNNALFNVEGFSRGTTYQVKQGEELIVAIKIENEHAAKLEVTASVVDENNNVLETLTNTIGAEGFWNPTFSTTNTEQLEEGTQQMCVDFTDITVKEKVLV